MNNNLILDYSIKDENNYIEKNFGLTSQELMLLKSLKIFYSNEDIFNLLISIINSENFISRRTIEYFVTNYSFINNTNYILNIKGENINFFVHSSYKNQLKAYKKKYFDPFGRGIRIPFFSKDTCIITTIGQLNFYKWFFSKNIYDYLLKNYETIQNSLLNNKTNTRILKKHKRRQKFEDYSLKHKNNGDIIVSFDI